MQNSPKVALSTQVMSKDWTQDSPILPHHLMTPPERGSSSQPRLMNNWAHYSTIWNALDERDTEENKINRALLLSYQLQRQKSIMNEREQRGGNDHSMPHGEDRRKIMMELEKICYKNSKYRGVIKCNDDRFEAFVWDTTIPGVKGRTVYIGGYSTEVEAARAHDMVAIKIGGLSTSTNFPERYYWKEFCEMQGMSKKEYILAVRRMGKGFTDTDCPYRGVYRIPESRRWEARLGRVDKGKRSIYLGTYYTAEDAARAFDIALIKLRGKAAITNFDVDSYDVKAIVESARREGIGGLSYGNNNKAYPHMGMRLTETNSSSFPDQHNTIPHQQMAHNYNPSSQQNHNLIPSNYPIFPDGFTFTGSSSSSSGGGGGGGVNNNDIISSGNNYGATFPNHSTTGQDQEYFQAAPQAQQNLNVNNNNGLIHQYQNLANNNQVVQQSPNRLPPVHGSQSLEFRNCINSPSGFGRQILGGNINNGESSIYNWMNEKGSCSSGVQTQSNSMFGLAVEKELPRVEAEATLSSFHDRNALGRENGQNQTRGKEIDPMGPYQGSEAPRLQLSANSMNQISFGAFTCNLNTSNLLNPCQNLNSSGFSSKSIQNPCSEPNTAAGSQSQSHERIGCEDDFGISEYLNNSYMEGNDCTVDDFEIIE